MYAMFITKYLLFLIYIGGLITFHTSECTASLCARAYTITCYSLYRRFRPPPQSCLLAHWESSRFLSFRCVVQSHCRVIFFLNFVLFQLVFSQPSIYIDGWLYGMRMTSVVCNVPVLSQNDSTYHHSVFTT